MAGNRTFLTITLLGDISNMSRGFKKARTELRGFENSVNKSMGSINRMFGMIGVGLGVTGLTNLAKAASTDAASFRQMSIAIKNVTGATDEQIQSAEAYVQTLSNQFGIVDDDLRPALTTLTAVYGNVTDAQAAMVTTLDLAAYAGVDAQTAAVALAKAHQGSYRQLTKLTNGYIQAGDPLSKVTTLTKGLAQAASDTDPFKKLQVVFDNLQETLGQYLLPYVQQFATWLSTEQGQTTLTQIADAFHNIAVFVFNIISWLGNNFWLAATIVGLTKLISVFYELYKVTQVIKKAYKEMVVLQTIMTSLKMLTGPQALILAGTAALGITAFIEALPNMFGETGITMPQIDPFNPTGNVPPKVVDPKLPSKKSGPLATTNDAIKKGIATLKAQLTKVRDLIASFATKFRDAVDLSFGVIERGAGKLFRADRYVRELRRVKNALADFQTNLAKLRALGGAKATPLIQQILGKSPEEAAAIIRGFIGSPQLFQDAIALTTGLGVTGARVGATASNLAGNPDTALIVSELKTLNQQLKTGKNTYNIRATMTAQEILAAIRGWERSTGKKVLVG